MLSREAIVKKAIKLSLSKQMAVDMNNLWPGQISSETWNTTKAFLNMYNGQKGVTEWLRGNISDVFF